MYNFCYLFRQLREYRRYSVILPVLGCAAQVLVSIVQIYMPKVVLDAIGQNADVVELLRKVFMMGMLLTAVTLVNMVIHNTIESCSQTFLYRRLIRMWEEKVMDMDYEIFTSHTGKIAAEKARNASSSPNWGVVEYLPKLTGLLEAVFGLFTFGAIIFTLHPVILLFLLVLFGIELWFSLETEKKKQSIKDEKAEVGRRLNYIAYETRGMEEGKDIRVYSMASWLRKITEAVIAGKRGVEQKQVRWEFQRMLLSGMFIFIRDGGAYLYLIYAFLHEDMNIGDFVLYFSAITCLGQWLMKLTEKISQFTAANNYVTDFREFMELGAECETEKQAYDRTEESINHVSFKLENVSFSYVGENGEETPVLSDINLSIAAGEKLAIVGVNGAGKTTLVKLLCGMLQPQHGRILVNGKQHTEYGKEKYFSLFSAVFQKSGVLPVSIEENITLNIKETPDEEALWKCIHMADLERKISSLPGGIETRLVRDISQGTDFSGGELQRLLLARALYKDAPVLMLDEPTAALDPIAENEIYQKYNQFTQGKTAVFISHRLASTRFCDRIILLEQGRIVECGTHDELVKAGGRYAEMFRLQSQYYKSEVDAESWQGSLRAAEGTAESAVERTVEGAVL